METQLIKFFQTNMTALQNESVAEYYQAKLNQELFYLGIISDSEFLKFKKR